MDAVNYEAGTSRSWDAIFDRYDIHEHNFDTGPFYISAQQIKVACQHFERTVEKEVRILCKQDNREGRPRVFRENGLFILPVRNGRYVILKGEGYVDVPPIRSPLREYHSSFPFELETTKIGDSEMQHLDHAYALSLIRSFANDDSLVLTIRGRKYTPAFDFSVGGFNLNAKSVQTEVDAGYEGASQIILIEAKSGGANNTIIRQLYYPFRQWERHTSKPVSTLFFQRTDDHQYHIWQFGFDEPEDYNSIRLLKSERYKIMQLHR